MAPEPRAVRGRSPAILWSLSDEERRRLFEDEKSRERPRDPRAVDGRHGVPHARGEQVDWSQFGPPRREMTDEERQRMREECAAHGRGDPEERARAGRDAQPHRQRDGQHLATGTAQSGAPRAAMMGRAGGRGGPGGMMGRPGGGGGQRGTR